MDRLPRMRNAMNSLLTFIAAHRGGYGSSGGSLRSVRNQITVHSERILQGRLSHYEATCGRCNASLSKHDDPNLQQPAWNTFDKRCDCSDLAT